MLLRGLRAFLLINVLLAVAVTAVADEQPAIARLEDLRSDPLLLRRFLEEMPKGGDLHEHLSGAVYAESFLDWAIKDGLCVDRVQLSIVAAPCDETKGLVPANKVLTDSALYSDMIDAMSMRNFRPGDDNGHDHFFSTFRKFAIVSGANHAADMAATVYPRFAAENVDYIESLFGPDYGAARQLSSLVKPGASFAEMRETLLKSGKVTEVVANARKVLDEVDARAGRGKTTLRYLYEVHRAFPREMFFSELVVAFETASVDPRVVGLNPVQPEDAWASMANFDEQMAMFAYLRPLYPKTRLSAHAGELAAGLVPPEGLRNHVRDTVMIAKAERIGHGVDVARENDMPALLHTMASRGVAVEICLTSNDAILGVTGRDHPLRLYMRNDVPVVLATDDAGVARGDMTTEYQRAVTEHGLGYRDLKRIARNSIQYSFLEGEGLWTNGSYESMVPACAKQGKTCDAFLAKNAKAREQMRLEQRFRDFEASISVSREAAAN